VQPDDLVIAVSGSGENTFYCKSWHYCKKIGSKLASDNLQQDSTLGNNSDIVVIVREDPGRYCLWRLSRTRMIGYPQLAPWNNFWDFCPGFSWRRDFRAHVRTVQARQSKEKAYGIWVISCLRTCKKALTFLASEDVLKAPARISINLGLGQPILIRRSTSRISDHKLSIKVWPAYTMESCVFPRITGSPVQEVRMENHFTVSPNEIIVTSGASEALHLALSHWWIIGDEVLHSPDRCAQLFVLFTLTKWPVEMACWCSAWWKVDTMHPEAVNELITPRDSRLLSLIHRSKSHRNSCRQDRK